SRLRSQHSLRARQLAALAPQRLAQRPADTLEAGLDHMVAVLTRDAHVNRGAEGLRERAEEVRHQLGGQATHGLPVEAAGELREGAARKVDGDLHPRLVHRQQETVAGDAHLRAERPPQSLSEREPAVFHGVMLVDLEVALAREIERKAAVLGELLQHVIEEPDARGDPDRSRVVQVDAHVDLRFPRPPADLGTPCREGVNGCGPTLLGRSVLSYPDAAY